MSRMNTDIYIHACMSVYVCVRTRVTSRIVLAQ